MKPRGENLREDLAEYAHQAWSGWMQYLFANSTPNGDGSWTIEPDLCSRWRRLMTTPYAALPPEEQAADRAEADRMVEVFVAMLERLTEDD